MKILAAAFALLIPAAVAAQAFAGLEAPAAQTFSTGNFSEAFASPPKRETPAVRRIKLERALALQKEAARLLADDGGKLLAEHREYVLRQRSEILNYGR